MTKRRKHSRRYIKRKIIAYMIIIPVLIIMVVTMTSALKTAQEKRVINNIKTLKINDRIKIKEELLDKNANSRDGRQLEAVRNIVIHYVANPGSSAEENRNYFNNEDTEVNAHFVVGLEGEIVQCLPLSERSVSSNWRNMDIIAIEVCHKDETGKFNSKTMDSLIELTAWLCHECDLKEDDVIRHYDITGKLCPLYYVEHPKAWEDFIKEVGQCMDSEY